MNKLYIIVPAILLVVYIFFYRGFLGELEVRDAEKARVAAEAVAAEQAKKQETERKAKEEADKRTADRTAEEKRKEDERVAKYNADNKRITDDTTGYVSDAQRYTKMIADLEVELANLRTQKEKASRESLDLLKRVELARIAKRNAELNIQRMTEMISRRASSSSLVQAPPPPAPAR